MKKKNIAPFIGDAYTDAWTNEASYVSAAAVSLIKQFVKGFHQGIL